jgi:uncharacterized SAM-binding protein YcdF (DUF218 family)
MMFIAAKFLSLLAQPLHWVVVLMVATAAVRSRPRASQALLFLALAVMVLVGVKPLPDLILHHLENQYTEIAPGADLGGFEGVVVLGGATESGVVQQAHQQPLLGPAAERMTAVVAIHQQNPALRIVFTGGEGELLGQGPSEAQRAQQFFESLGLTGVQYESASRNTYDNAVFTAQLPGVDPHKRWLLLTSAWHMPRAVGTFSKAGWNVTAYPVDYRTGNETRWSDYSLLDGANAWQLALHEMLGLVAYRVTGRM